MTKRAFLVDWDAASAAATADRLRAEEWDVKVECDDGDRAYQETGLNPPDVVVVSLATRPGHGLETAKAIHHRVSTATVPIVFICEQASLSDKAVETVRTARVVDETGLLTALSALA